MSLAPGETRTVDIGINPATLTVVNADGERIPGSGNWTLFAGTGQPDSRTAELTGKSSVAAELR